MRVPFLIGILTGCLTGPATAEYAEADSRAATAPVESGTAARSERSDGEDTNDSVARDSSTASKGEPISAEMAELRGRIRRCLAYYFHRPEQTSRRCPWEVMHCIVGFGVDTPLRYDADECNAVAWLCENLPCDGVRMLYARDGRLGVRMGPEHQGHRGQLLSILAQARVKIDYPLRADRREFTVADLVEYEKRSCESHAESSFQLIGLANYLDTEASWKNRDGQTWDIPRLIREELAQPVVGACCGGTHRLMGLSYAVRKREKSGQPMTGQWRRAKKYVDDFHEYTFALQNSDGSFSSEWFRGPGGWGGDDRKLNTTGHILEWMVYSRPKDELTDPRVVRAVERLTDLLWENRRRAVHIGHLGHALHALAMYDEYVFSGQPGRRASQLASYWTDEPMKRYEESEWVGDPVFTPSSPSRIANEFTIPRTRPFAVRRRDFR
jgi:hypothetical protein